MYMNYQNVFRKTEITVVDTVDHTKYLSNLYENN